MPRTYIRKSDRTILSDEKFRTAQQLVQNGCSTRFAAKVIGASVSGLRNRLSHGVVASSLGRNQTFNKEQENDFIEYCKKAKGSEVTRNDLRVLAFEYATANNIKNQFVKSSGRAGYDWVRGFLNRHPELLTKPGERSDHHTVFDLTLYKPATQVSHPAAESGSQRNHDGLSLTLERLDEFLPDDDMASDESDLDSDPRDPIKIEMNFEKLAEFQAEEELEFGSARAQTQPPKVYAPQRVAASAPPPLPQSANPMFWPEEPQPKIRPGPGADECQIFGDFVASELRTLRSDESRKRLKRIIQKAILNIGEEEDVNIISG
ncbi:uncharacterized protein LOC121732017 [Aricia agestis]|uniref:uncharacterized protein LOC121732017 n=1 Tax=Aricia agestis TaxID=91739 RepID=UPI001C201F01|nr:uncharacterized protein LOC121732017 [Aricia agestis]